MAKKNDADSKHLERLEQILNDAPEQNWVHPWMYSFMMADSEASGHDEIYLVAFCKNCRKGLTTMLSRSYAVGETVLTDLDVPKYGCVAP